MSGERAFLRETVVRATVIRADRSRHYVDLRAELYDDLTAVFPDLEGLLQAGDEIIIPTGEELWRES